jgi:hypothetical protein
MAAAIRRMRIRRAFAKADDGARFERCSIQREVIVRRELIALVH